MSVWAGADQENRYTLILVSGDFVGNTTAVFDLRPWAPPSFVPIALPDWLQGRPARTPATLASTPTPGRLLLDYRTMADVSGTVVDNNRVMLKPDASSPEVPYAGARVRLHHLPTGRLDWQGLSDANGYYRPTDLEVGQWYYPVAIDPAGMHECDAAGPVQAVRAPDA